MPHDTSTPHGILHPVFVQSEQHSRACSGPCVNNCECGHLRGGADSRPPGRTLATSEQPRELAETGPRSVGGPHGHRPRGAVAGLDPKIDRRLLNLHEAAAYLNVSYWTARDLVNFGKVPSVRLPNPRARDGRNVRRILIDRSDLDRLIGAWKESA
jgi:hypothetical protein